MLPQPAHGVGAAAMQGIGCRFPILGWRITGFYKPRLVTSHVFVTLNFMNFEPLPGLSVTVDSVSYDPTRPAPPDRPHPFVYHLSIHNASHDVVRIFGRKWIVRDTDGDTMVVEGDGVVGQFPNLSPGETFSYNSYHVIKTESTATGSFFGTTPDGRRVCTRIPAIEMHPPMPA